MQILYGADASNINLTAQKRLIRVVEGQTQATPYAAYLDPSLRESSGGIRVPAATDEASEYPLKRSAAAFTYQGSLTPGLCLVKTIGESLAIHNGVGGATTTGDAKGFALSFEQPVKTFGLLGQWIGGTFDGVKSQNEISAWQGVDSVYDLLAPAWNDTGLAAEVSAATAGKPVYLFAGPDGRLCGFEGWIEGTKTSTNEGVKVARALNKTKKEIEESFEKGEYVIQPVAEVIERPSSSVLRIKLLV